jgi:putative nucleotidyltransferase with HDIG domain
MPIDVSIFDATLREPYGEEAYRIVERLTDAGFDTWWVGGAVRDMLEGAVPKDIDIATAATPNDVSALFPRSKVVEDALGSTRVRSGNFVYEVTTFREETDEAIGRKPAHVLFSTRTEDAARRDLTINALYVHPVSHELYDPYEGEADLREKLIRFIGQPAERIRQDALRMFRAIRMCARIDGQYHPDTYAAIQKAAPLIESISSARQLDELRKLLQYPRAAQGLEEMWELGVLAYSFPELHRCKGIPQPSQYHQEGDVWNHLLQCVAAFRPDDLPDVRLAALLHDIGKAETFDLKERIRFDRHAEVSAQMADALLMRCHVPAHRREKIVWLIAHHMMMEPLLTNSVERKDHWYHHIWFEDLLRMFWLDIAGTTPSEYMLYDRIVDDRHRFLDRHPRPMRPLLTGERIMELTGLRPSSRVGEILGLLAEAQARGEIVTRVDAEALVRTLDDAVQ